MPSRLPQHEHQRLLPLVLQLAEKTEERPLPKAANQIAEGTPYFIKERDRFVSPIGVPCQNPPFDRISEIDLNAQKLAWSIPAGTVQDTSVMGIRAGLPIPIGMPTVGGSMVTQGGLPFFTRRWISRSSAKPFRKRTKQRI